MSATTTAATMAAVSLEQTSADLKKSRAVLHHLTDTFQSIQSHLYSIMALSDQWGTFQNSFMSVQLSLGSHIRELEVKERESNSLRISLENREKEVELLQKKLDFVEKSLSEGWLALEMRERDFNERIEVLELEKKRVKEWRKVVEAKERRTEERSVAVEERERGIEERERRVGCGEMEERDKAVELKEKEVAERCEAVEVGEERIGKRWIEVERRDKEIEERCRVVELREKESGEVCRGLEEREKKMSERDEWWKSREEQFDRRSREVVLMEKLIDERCTVAELKEKRIDEHCRVAELKEKQVDERCRLAELMEKEIDEHCKVVELRERGIDERCKAQELRDKQLSEQGKGLELKDKRINVRFGELELKEKQIDERCRVAELKKKKMDKRCKTQELRDKQLNEHCKRLELKEKRIDERLEELELKENQIELKLKQTEEACEELELKEKRIIEHTEAIKLKDEQMSEKYGGLEYKENYINEILKSLELKEKQINERCEALTLREEVISERYQALDLKEKDNIELSRALELKKKEISRHRNAKELGEKQRDVHIKALEFKGKRIEKCFQVQECKKNEVNKPCANSGLKEEHLSDISGMEMKSVPYSNLGTDEGFQSLSLKQCLTDGKTLLMFLNDRVDEHRFMEEEVSDALKLYPNPGKLVLTALDGFFSPHWRKGNVVYKASAVRSSCVLLLEQLMKLKPKVYKKSKTDAKQVALLWKAKMRKEGESRVVVLGFLLLVAAFCLRKLFKRDELQRLYEMVDQDRIAPQLRLELELFEVNEGSDMATGPPEVTTRQLQSDILQVTDAVASSAMNHCSEIHSLCHSMDANGLRSYIGQHLMEQNLSLEKVLDALRCAPDPAKLLLDVVKIFNLPESTAVEKTNCIILLEQLMKLQKQQPSLNSLGRVEQKTVLELRQKANMFACIWKQTLAEKGYKILEVYGFLQFLATYKLASSFKEKDLFGLYKLFYGGNLVYRPEQNPCLCRALGLEKRIPGLIKSLIKKDRRLQAVKYICTFMMESCFPLVPLLKDHLKFTKEKSVKLRMRRNNSHAAKIDGTRFEISNLQVVLRYINDYKLEPKLSRVSLESRIKELETQIAELETATTKVEQTEATELKEGLKDDISMSLEMDMVENGSTQLVKAEKNPLPPASPADTTSELFGGKKRTSGPSPSFVLPQEKRLRAGDSMSMKGMSAPQLGPGPWRKIEPCTSGHQPHVRPSELLVLPHGGLPAVNGSSAQFGFPGSNEDTPYRGTGQIVPTAGINLGGINAELKPAITGLKQAAETKEGLKDTISVNMEKDIVENNSTHLVNKAENMLSPVSPAETASELFDQKKSSSPSSSLVLPQEEKHLREGTLESPVPPNIPIACPITTHSASMNQPQPSLRQWRQLGPYTYRHLAHVRPNGLPVLHPGQMPAVNGPSAHFGIPGSSYGVTPYRGPGQFRPTAGIGPTPAPGQFNPTAGIGSGGTPALRQFRPTAEIGPGGQFNPTAGIDPGGTPALGQFNPTVGIGPGGIPAPGQFGPTAGIGPGGTPAPGQFRPTVGIGPSGTPAPRQFRSTAGIGPGGTPIPGQFRPNAGIGPGGIHAPGYFVGGQVPYRPR